MVAYLQSKLVDLALAADLAHTVAERQISWALLRLNQPSDLDAHAPNLAKSNAVVIVSKALVQIAASPLSGPGRNVIAQ